MSEVTGRFEGAPSRRFRPYPEYKESGVEWLGEIPAAWNVQPLKNLANFSTGWTPPTGREDLYGGEHLWANISDLGPRVLETTEKTISDAAIREARLRVAEGGSLLFSFKLSIGIVSIAGVDMYTNEAIATFAPSPLIDTGYLFWAAPILIPHNAQDNIYGAPLLSRERIANAKVLRPPPPEQRAIAAFLDRETAKIDALVARKERLIELLQEKRTALITRAVTRGLDPNVPMKDSGVEWLGEIPAHWKVKRLHHLLDPGKPLSYGILLPGPRLDEGVPYIGAGDVAPGRLRLEALPRTTPEIAGAYPRTRMQPGELVYAIRGSFGSVGIIGEELAGVNLSRDAARIGPAKNTNCSWLAYALRSRSSLLQFDFREIGATITGVNIRDLRRILLPVPPHDDQPTIAAFLDRQTADLDALVVKIQEAINHLKEFRTALISAAVTGKIDVREAVPR